MTAQNRPPDTSQMLAEENQRLKRAVEELSILNDLARTIGASLNSQEIIHTIVNRSLRATHAEQGVITLVEEEAENPMRTLVRTNVGTAQHPQYHLTQSLLGWMHLNRKPLMINDPAHDARFQGVTWDASIRSLVCVPMMIKSALKGVLTVYNKTQGPGFTEDDQRLLSIIAAQSAQIIENARLYESELALQRMTEELRLARQIQTELLPREFPAIPGYDIAGKSVPAQVVGGDYFDFIPMEEGGLAICLGDVSGKGLPASLLMANVQATLRGQTLLCNSAKTCLDRANKLLYQSTSSEKFVTLFYAVFHPPEENFCFTNAGHDHPFLIAPDGSVTRLTTGGIALSILERFPFEEECVSFNAGNLLVIYSDGITEAINEAGEQFGEERLAEVLCTHRSDKATAVIDATITAVKMFTGNVPQRDDMTMVAVKRLPG